MMLVSVLLFDRFEPLDAFGPVEVLGHCPDTNIRYLSQNGGVVVSNYGVRVYTQKAEPSSFEGVLLVPGGPGTRTLVNNSEFLGLLVGLAQKAEYCLSVCTGSGLLAAGGVLDGIEATSNKNAMKWAESMGPLVKWKNKARWTESGKIFSSGGVAAGTDMALAFVERRFGREQALEIARKMEYIWNDSAENDPFARTEEGEKS